MSPPLYAKGVKYLIIQGKNGLQSSSKRKRATHVSFLALLLLLCRYLAKMYRYGIMCRVAVHVAAIGQVALDLGRRHRQDVLRVAEDPHRLHALRHVLQPVAVDHPDARVLDAQPPRPPPALREGRRRLVVPEQHRRIPEDRLCAFQLPLHDL